MWLAKNRRNRRAVRIGYALFVLSIVVLISGVLLTRQFGFDLKQPLARSIIYWAHIVAPLAAIWLYWLHRLVGPRIKWYVGGRIALATAAQWRHGLFSVSRSAAMERGGSEGRRKVLPAVLGSYFDRQLHSGQGADE